MARPHPHRAGALLAALFLLAAARPGHAQTWTITTAASPYYGGVTTGDGAYDAGASVTVIAAPVPGFQFVDWSAAGTIVSTSPSYTFVATGDSVLTAEFVLGVRGALFDFDSGWPTLGIGAGIPLSQLAQNITLQVTAPAGMGFSIQSDANLFSRMALFTGHYLYPSNLGSSRVDLAFDRPLAALTFDFATADFNQAELPSPVQVDLFADAAGTIPAGTASGRGAYIGSTMPMGALTVSATQPFVAAHIWMPPCPTCSSDLLLDNLIVAVPTPIAVPREGATTALRLAASPNPARGATAIAFALPAAGPAQLAVYDLAGRRVALLASGVLEAGAHEARWAGTGVEGVPVATGMYVVRLEAGGATLTRRVLMLR